MEEDYVLDKVFARENLSCMSIVEKPYFSGQVENDDLDDLDDLVVIEVIEVIEVIVFELPLLKISFLGSGLLTVSL